MADFVEIVRPAGVAVGSGVRVTIAEHCDVALFNVRGRLFAIEDLCVRCGTSLAEGTLQGVVVACRGCDWRYDVTTGRVNDIPALQIDTFDAKVVDGCVMIATTPKATTHMR